MAYELHEWSGEGRHMVDRLLTGEDVMHAWQGATLIVRELDEERVDELIRQAELATMPTLDKDSPTMAYELAEYGDDLRGRLTDLLAVEGIAHEFDAAGDLIVNETDEDAVDGVFEKLESGADQPLTFGPGIEGVAATDVISDLFVTTNRLRKTPGDHKAVLKFADTSELAEQLQLPFGFQSTDWREILDLSAHLRAVLRGEAEDEDDDVSEVAQDLYEILRPLV